jgi:ABC-type oligopeptide transport system substrate-binding subunit
MTSQQPLRRLPLAAAVCAALLFALPACAQTTAAAPAAVSANEPAKVEKNAATGIAKLTLTEKGVERLDLKTDTVKAGKGKDVVVPYAALLYDSSGKTWVYTNPAPRVYQRQAVTVAKVEDGLVTASAGPAVGTTIVTVGAAELFGAEFDTAH